MTKSLKKLLIDLNLDVTSVAKGIDRSRTWTSLVMNGRRRSDVTRKAILDFLRTEGSLQGVRVTDDVWPLERRVKRRRSVSNQS